jgi:hypothetical protein
VLGRTAQNLFWLSRYVERAENMARLLDVGYRMSLTSRRVGGSSEHLVSMMQAAEVDEEFYKKHEVADVATVAADHERDGCLIGFATQCSVDPPRFHNIRTLIERLPPGFPDRGAEVDGGQRAGLSTDERAEIRELKRKNRELEQTVEILKAATSFFARESDPRLP